MPAASIYALCEGLSEVGVKRNSGIGIFEDADGRTFAVPHGELNDDLRQHMFGPKGWTDGPGSAARCSRSG